MDPVKLKIFIGWSGERSKVVAQRLSERLPTIIHNIQTIFSPKITGGSIWTNEIARGLNESAFGIMCITKENYDTSWINFEAGALWKGVENNFVCPVLFDITLAELEGPMADFFQSKAFKEDDIRELCRFLGNKTGMDPYQVDENFKLAWPRLDKVVNSDISEIEENRNKLLNLPETEANKIFEIKIITPEENEEVQNPIELKGSYTTKPPDDIVRILEYDPYNHLYWPKAFISFDEKNKEWFAEINIGGKAGRKRKLIVAAIGKNGKALLDYSKKVFETDMENQRRIWPGISTLTQDIVICDYVMIIKKDRHS